MIIIQSQINNIKWKFICLNISQKHKARLVINNLLLGKKIIIRQKLSAAIHYLLNFHKVFTLKQKTVCSTKGKVSVFFTFSLLTWYAL